MKKEIGQQGLSESSDQKLLPVEQRMSFSGPLPHPSILKEYEEVLSGLADRITTMAESQSAHRKKLESRVITFDIFKSTAGLFLAFFIVIFALIVGAYVALKGQPVAGGFIGLVPLGSIVGLFIQQNYPRQSQKEEKK